MTDDQHSAPVTGGDNASESEKPKTKWDDPSVPIGNAPPVSRAPLVFFSLAWAAFVVFLFVMVLSRYEAS